MERIIGLVQPYAWGSRTGLAALRGETSSDEPEAELWYGSHPVAPSRVAATGRELEGLPYLLKILAAAEPLSIQTHPNREQAQIGFAREEQSGLALTAPTRTYRDPNHKPEIIVALTPFEALCGFRPADETIQVLSSLSCRELAPFIEVLRRSPDADGLRHILSELLTMPESDRRTVVAAVTRAADRSHAPTADLVTKLSSIYPGDIGVVVALLLNHLTLAPGEAIFLAAGNLHAYLEGTGVEVMAASDNVVRGGLTPKHIDVPELLRVVDTTPLDDPRYRPVVDATPGVEIVRYHPSVDDFAVDRITLDGMTTSWAAEHDEIILVTSGTVNGLGPTEAAIVRADESVSLRGTGVAWRVFQP